MESVTFLNESNRLITCAGIQEELSRLSDIEDLQEQWRAQVEAQDEVERLLQAYDSSDI